MSRSYASARPCPICGVPKYAASMQGHLGSAQCYRTFARNGGEYHDPIRARTALAGIATAMHQAWGADWKPSPFA